MNIGRAQLIQSHSSARFCFELSGNLKSTEACNSNFGQNFELEFTLNKNFKLQLTSNYFFELWLPLI